MSFVYSLWFGNIRPQGQDRLFYLNWTHQILYHTHPLTAELRHEAIDIHKVVISDVLNNVVQSDKHACSSHTGAEE